MSTFNIFRALLLGVLMGMLPACALRRESAVVTPESSFSRVAWTPDELRELLTNKVLKTTPHASYHLIRLSGAEKPHVHAEHDLVIFVLRGKAKVHLAGRAVLVTQGDVIEIPMGVVHWAESLGRAPCEVYAVFTPAFDGKDHREV